MGHRQRRRCRWQLSVTFAAWHSLLRELQRDMALSDPLITHDIGAVEYIADEVAVRHAERIVDQGSVVLRQACTRDLLAAVPRIGQHP
jgi:peptide/nickel transport system ATP-binding protein